ncbi:MAG: ATP-binding protein [Opitutaceae bacterium]
MSAPVSKAIEVGTAITLRDLPAVLRIAAAKRRSVFLLSTPGVGKTEVITGLAGEAKAKLVVLVASLLDRLDLAGLPYTYQDKSGKTVTGFAPMALMADLSQEHNPDGGPVWLYLNELNAAADLSVTPTLYRLIAERAVGSLTLRDNVFIVADGNPASSLSAGRDMHMAMRRRFQWFTVRADLGAWRDWALNHGVDARVPAFLGVPAYAPHFSNFDPANRTALTFGCPATWARLGADLEEIERVTDEGLTLAMICGQVGEKAGTDFAGFLAHAGKIPDAYAVLDDPAKAPIPKEIDRLSLLCGGIVNLCVKTADLTEQALRYALRLHEVEGIGGHAEFALFLARSLAAMPKTKAAMLESRHLAKLAKIVAGDKFAVEAFQAA